MSEQIVRTYEHEGEEQSKPEYVLLKPRHTPAREGSTYQVLADHQDVEFVVSAASRSRILALDLETSGLLWHLSERIVGLGLAWDSGSCYFNWNQLSKKNQDILLDMIFAHPGLIAHNVGFDGGMLYQQRNRHPYWAACTFSLFRHLANEGWMGQSHSLKTAMTDVLLWPETNETEIDEWLVFHGYYKGVGGKDATPESLLERYRAGNLSPQKGEMWRVPAEILGKYCILDTEACYLFYTEHLEPVLKQFPLLKEHQQDLMLPLILEHIEQKVLGIPVNQEGLLAREEYLHDRIQEQVKKLRSHPDARDHIAVMEMEKVLELAAKEPPKLKKDGEISKNWIKWKKKMELAETGQDPKYQLNLNSGQQLAELLYQRMEYPVLIKTDKGEPSTSGKAFLPMGEVGQILLEQGFLEKERTYIASYRELSEYDGKLHPTFKCPGTTTGRLSSSEPNMQQIPKSKAVMSLFQAPPGKTWIDIDFAALEAMVAAEFSRDENMLKIYGPDAPENDIHLFIAAHVPGLQEKVLATGYLPYAPTRDGLIRAKKEAKAQRSIAKTVVYACQFGAGVNKVFNTLQEDGVKVSREEVEAVHKTYWRLFQGIRTFANQLEEEWIRNGGYILNGLGRPMAVLPEDKKDLLNRFIQSTGHDILLKYIKIYTSALALKGVKYSPLIIDWHDSSAVEVDDKDVEATCKCMKDSMLALNKELGGLVQFKGEPDYGKDLAAIKKPEE